MNKYAPKKLLMYSPDGQLLKEWASMKEALLYLFVEEHPDGKTTARDKSKYVMSNRDRLKRHLDGRSNIFKGFVWKEKTQEII